MSRFRNLIALFAFSLLILALPNFASAQWNTRNTRNTRNDDDYYGNNNNNRNYNRNLQGTIRSLKNHSSQFERRLDRELDDSRYDGTNREDRILQIAQDFQDATDRLDAAYDNRSDYSRSQDEARSVLQLGKRLERAVSRARLNQSLSSDWNRIRQDLNVLSNAYNNNNNRGGYNRNGGYGRNNDGDYDDDDDYNRNSRNDRNDRNNPRTTNNNNNRDWRRAIPFPLPF